MREFSSDYNMPRPRVSRPVPIVGRAGVVTPENPLRPLHPPADPIPPTQPPALTAPPSTPAAPPRLRRAWFGLAPATAQQLLAEQGRELQARVQALRAELQAELARQDELAGDVRRTRARLEAQQDDLQMLSATLEQERQREAVTAEVAARQLAALRQANETRMQDLRFEGIRLEAELERRESGVLAIAAELYRIASANGQLPSGLRVQMPEPGAEAPAPPAETPAPPAGPQPELAADVTPADRNRMLVGKRLRRPLLAPDGRLIGASGDAISDAMITAAEEHGLVTAMIGGLALPDET